MNYQIERRNWGQFFSVPSEVAVNHIKLVSGAFLKVLLFILSSAGDELTTEEISASTGVPSDIADDAVVYWSSCDIISVKGAKPSVRSGSPEIKPNNPPAVSSISAAESINPAKKALESSCHVKYSARDIADIINSQNDKKEMFSQLEVILKRPLKLAEQCGYINIADNLGFSPAAILILAQYCENIGKASIRYIETIAQSLFEQELTSYKDVEQEIIRMTEARHIENKVSKLFGLNTALTKKQREYIKSWSDMGFELDMIELAYEKCVDQTNKLSFPYINKIIENWHKNSVTNKAEAQRLDLSVKKKKNRKTEHSYDLEEFDEFTLNYTPKLREDR